MTPDGIIRCTVAYTGKNHKGQTVKLEEGKQYIKTTANGLVFLNEFDQPARQLPWLTEEEYAQLQGKHVQ